VVEGRTARLVSLNVGRPRDVDWNGRTVRTAVWKHPVRGPRMVRTLNVDGDGQGDLAGHGGPHRAILVYQFDSYRYWQLELGRDDLEPGHFGENFTVDGLADDDVRIGDRYRIGDALFEVSQPRVTCYRVGLRLGEPQLPALLVSHHRPGFYLRVLHEGAVQAGDEIVRVRTSPDSLTVAAIDALLYLPGHDRRDVARALRIPALSPGWRTSFESLAAATDEATGNPGLSARPPTAPVWAGLRPLRVLERVTETTDVVSLHLGSADGSPLPPARPGQFLTLRLATGDDRPDVTRNYSLSGPPASGAYRISVKREPDGVGSAAVHRVPVGSVVDASAPRGVFTLTVEDRPVLLLSAGIGVTPVLAMLHALAESGSARPVTWLHGARNSAEHAFADEVAGLLDRLPNRVAHSAYSAPLPHDRLGRDHQSRGRLSAALLADLDLRLDGEAYLCGPAAFMADLHAALTALGMDPSRVHVETFGPGPALSPGIVDGADRPAPHPPVGAPGNGPAVTFARSNLTVRWRPSDTSLLDLAEACDVPVRWSCRTGVCHNCETGLLDGAVTYRPEPVDSPATGNVLICSAVPARDVLLDI
jgi:ferredoxin-NADP reductase/MOSC domain-containing protein YiiM